MTDKNGIARHDVGVVI